MVLLLAVVLVAAMAIMRRWRSRNTPAPFEVPQVSPSAAVDIASDRGVPQVSPSAAVDIASDVTASARGDGSSGE